MKYEDVKGNQNLIDWGFVNNQSTKMCELILESRNIISKVEYENEISLNEVIFHDELEDNENFEEMIDLVKEFYDDVINSFDYIYVDIPFAETILLDIEFTFSYSETLFDEIVSKDLEPSEIIESYGLAPSYDKYQNFDDDEKEVVVSSLEQFNSSLNTIRNGFLEWKNFADHVEDTKEELLEYLKEALA